MWLLIPSLLSFSSVLRLKAKYANTADSQVSRPALTDYMSRACTSVLYASLSKTIEPYDCAQTLILSLFHTWCVSSFCHNLLALLSSGGASAEGAFRRTKRKKYLKKKFSSTLWQRPFCKGAGATKSFNFFFVPRKPKGVINRLKANALFHKAILDVRGVIVIRLACLAKCCMFKI